MLYTPSDYFIFCYSCYPQHAFRLFFSSLLYSTPLSFPIIPPTLSLFTFLSFPAISSILFSCNLLYSPTLLYFILSSLQPYSVPILSFPFLLLPPFRVSISYSSSSSILFFSSQLNSRFTSPSSSLFPFFT